jgi:hypothetical protein
MDEFGSGAERDHYAARREAIRVLAVGAYLEHAFRLPCAVNPADGGREKDFLRRLDNRGLGEFVHRLPIDPAAAAPLEEALAIRCGISPDPDQLRKTLGRIYARDFLRLPSGRGRRQGWFGHRSGSWRRRRLLHNDRGAAGFSGDGAVGAGGEVACCPASGAGAGAGGAAASGAAGSEGEEGAEGAAFCGVGTGARAGATGVVPRETGGSTLVWSIQKAVAIATSTTPTSKPHNQRDLAFPSRRSELSPMDARS